MQGHTVMCRHTNLRELAREIQTYSGCVRYYATVTIRAGNEPSRILKFYKDKAPTRAKSYDLCVCIPISCLLAVG